jgi:PEP-CTERM motif
MKTTSLHQFAGVFALAAILLFAGSARADVLDPTTGLDLFSGVSASGPSGLSGLPSQLVDNSGLLVGASGVLGAADSTATHLVGGTEASPDFLNDTNQYIGTPGDTVTFNLGSAKLLDNVVFWNFTQSDYNGNDFQDVGANSITIYAGLTLGTLVDLGNFTLNQTSGFPTDPNAPGDVANAVGSQSVNVLPTAAQYVEVVLNTSHLTPARQAALGNLVGLDEVHFEGAAIPEPSTYALLALGLVGLIAWQRKRAATPGIFD